MYKRIFYLYANSVISFLHMYVYHKKFNLDLLLFLVHVSFFLLSLG